MNDGGWEATALTLAIPVAAIVLAGIVGAALSFFASRTFATAEPFLAGGNGSASRRGAWHALSTVTRFALVLLRAIPEYIWTFLLVGMFGITALPAVLALAIHNAGILGKLDAETLENLRPAPLKALRGVGASRTQIALFAAFPAALSRYLLYFFYRWETCVREATVLGMLGILSLGYVIGDARVRFQYDRLLFFALVGCALVLLGDLVSLVVRHLVRRAR
jgi:phosphonate transport system permease protein